MNRRARKPILRALAISLLLCVCAGAGLCAPSDNAVLEELALNQRLQADAGETALCVITDLSGEYIFHAFSRAAVRATISQDGERIASGPLPLTCSLRAQAQVTVRLSSGAPYTFEVMRNALGRSAHSPIALSHTLLKRAVTRARDVHWYRYIAREDGEVLFQTQRAVNAGVNAQILAMNESGQALAQTRAAEDGSGVFVNLMQGDACLLRVCAEGDETGNYTLRAVTMGDAAAPKTIELSGATLSLAVGEWTPLRAAVSPRDASDALLWESSDPSVAAVSATGAVTAVGEGECRVTAYGFGGARARCLVYVTRAKVAGVSFAQPFVTAAVGDGIYLSWNVFPPYAGDTGVSFESLNPEVVSVNEEGFITCLSTGEAMVRVTTREGGFAAETTVTVTEPQSVYRALLVGISSYADGRDRTGCVNTTQGMADALTKPTDSGAGYITDMRLDVTKKELFAAIEHAFAGAEEADVSLFYINCHGGQQAGIAWLETQEGAKVSARELEAALRRVRGSVIVILDFCNSGAFIGASGREALFSGETRAFTPGTGKNAFQSAKYKALVSSSATQNSYRISATSPATESSMSTVFARALAEGLGFNIIKDKTGSLKADLDKNRQISLHEAYLYAYRKCMSYLQGSSARQSAQAWPRGDGFFILR